MSRSSKISFLAAFLLLVATFAVQVMTGAWINLNTVLLVGALVAVAAAVAFDWRLYLEFFTMRTTKHGMNMGVMIVLVLISVVCVNFLASRNDKAWDVTEEKLNSLSDQSVKVLEALKDDVDVKVFYKGPAAQEERQKAKQGLMMYAAHTNKLKIQYLNSHVENALATEYLNGLPDRDAAPAFVFLENQGRRIRVDSPFEEAQITAALIKATRPNNAKIYFIKGHGERELETEDDAAMGDFNRALKEASFQTESLNLIDRKEIPADATAVAIVGPSVQYLDSEIKWLTDYALKGGRLFILLDPGQRHNLGLLTKVIGVEFMNNYVVTMTPVVGGGPATVLGRTFSAENPITGSFPANSSFSVFPLISEVRAAPDMDPGNHAVDIVKSDNYSFTMNDISKPPQGQPQTKQVTLGIDVTGKPGKAEKSFEAVVFGDSDFVSNRALALGVNRDLALNAIAKLAEQNDLISIRPKSVKGMVMVLTFYQRLGVLIVGMALPVLLLVLAGVMWFRRRGA